MVRRLLGDEHDRAQERPTLMSSQALAQAPATSQAPPGATAPPTEAIVTTPTPGRRSSRLRLILMLGGLTMFAPLSIDMYLPALPTAHPRLQRRAFRSPAYLSTFFLGLALGQAIIGPFSDAIGRRKPLLIGLVAYALASLLCAMSPTILSLVGLRFVQGFAGAAGIVIARAIVRDLHSGVAAARFMSVLMLVSGLAPILAPVLGGQLLRFVPWQGIFFLLAVVGALLTVVVARGLPETLPVNQRQTGGLRETITTFGQLLSNRAFLGYALANGLAIAGIFAYISGSPFILQELYGVSPQTFSLIFAVNAIGMVTGRPDQRSPRRAGCSAAPAHGRTYRRCLCQHDPAGARGIRRHWPGRSLALPVRHPFLPRVHHAERHRASVVWRAAHRRGAPRPCSGCCSSRSGPASRRWSAWPAPPPPSRWP